MSAHHNDESHQRSEMLDVIKNLSENSKKVFRDDQGVFKPINEWTGVTVSMEGKVIEISWDGLFLDEGSLEFASLPHSLKSFSLHNSNIIGNLPLRDLPKGLQDFLMTNTNISGTVTIGDLPKGLRSLDLSQNHLEGCLDMENLPKTMQFMFLSENRFSGPLNLCSLPVDMQLLDLASNLFSDDIYIGNLPKDVIISLEDNPIDKDALVQNCQVPGSFIEDTGERIALLCAHPNSKKTVLAQLKGVMITSDDDSMCEGFLFEEGLLDEWDSDDSSE